MIRGDRVEARVGCRSAGTVECRYRDGKRMGKDMKRAPLQLPQSPVMQSNKTNQPEYGKEFAMQMTAPSRSMTRNTQSPAPSSKRKNPLVEACE